MRACAINAQTEILADVSTAFPPPQHNGDQISQDPHIWSQAMFLLFEDLSTQIDLQQVAAISIDGTSGTVLLCDKTGEPLTPALMYNDASSQAKLEFVRQACPDLPIVHSVAAGLPKLLQLADHVAHDNVAYAMHQADWLGCLLTHQPGHSDANNCLKTGFDAVGHNWPDCIARLTPINNWLPKVHRSGEDIAQINAKVAARTGLSARAILRAGTTDSTAAVIATGASQIGDAITSLGSTMVMKVISDRPVHDAASGVYSQPYGKRWLVGGGSNSGGAVLRQFFSDEQMVRLSVTINPDKDSGLDYYPLPNRGERFPINDVTMQPRLTPKPNDDGLFLQGLLEGMARIEQRAYQRLAELGAPFPTSVRTVGGGAVNQKWAAIRQRYLGVPVLDCHQQSTAFGSALIAMQQTVTRS